MHRTAFAVLRTEHSVMRQTFATLMAVLRAGEWRSGGPALDRLSELLEFEELFSQLCHRPKCDAVLDRLRGRSARLDGMRTALDATRSDEAHLRLHAMGLVAAVQRQEPGSDKFLAAVLQSLHLRLLEQMEWEDTVLLPEARRLLDGHAWSRLAVQFESVPYPAAAVYQLDACPPAARRWPESPAWFEDSGFMLDGQLGFDRVPRFKGDGAFADSQAPHGGTRA